MKYSIVDTDNFGRDYPNESFVAQNIPCKEMAKKMADALNTSPDQPRYYQVVEDGYVLVPGQPIPPESEPPEPRPVAPKAR